ncbi:MAG: hypothetical protein MJH09_04880 [Cetobacterium sp.]|nr:hypothetical protein [Cetobacterium sp.]
MKHINRISKKFIYKNRNTYLIELEVSRIEFKKIITKNIKQILKIYNTKDKQYQKLFKHNNIYPAKVKINNMYVVLKEKNSTRIGIKKILEIEKSIMFILIKLK